MDLFWVVRVVLRKVDATTQVRKSGITLLVLVVSSSLLRLLFMTYFLQFCFNHVLLPPLNPFLPPHPLTFLSVCMKGGGGQV